MKKLAVLLLAVLLVGCSPQPAVQERDPDLLYWSTGAVSQTGDGWQVTLFCDGVTETFSVNNAEAARMLATQAPVGLRFDDAGAIRAVLTPSQMPYQLLEGLMYVRRLDALALTVNSSLLLAGEEWVLPLGGQTKCYDMTVSAGVEAQPEAGDRVCCVLDAQGVLYRVYILKHTDTDTQYQMHGGMQK